MDTVSLFFLNENQKKLCLEHNLEEIQSRNSVATPCKSTCVSLCRLWWTGILHKGSGENIFVTEQPPVITSIMGNGRRRSISCPSCNGLADGNKLLAPVALAMGIDGSLYVGDLNFVRRVYPSMNTTAILELR